MRVSDLSPPREGAYMFVTDWGLYSAPAELAAAYDAAPLRKCGAMDMRYRASKEAVRIEQELHAAVRAEVQAEWIASGLIRARPTAPILNAKEQQTS